ncbi:hypothetical protein GUJ93_ZPchr0008g13542 [Zizania palustris]|uniref:Cytochrome P450 n=1 Tax=Zizania palustris TaxID=103762 RepID=A0A8J5RGF7_ZIZPA|nr:hypothetical protein GUJ93_ZPchr0008g13542 [Zizania palustris]
MQAMILQVFFHEKLMASMAEAPLPPYVLLLLLLVMVLPYCLFAGTRRSSAASSSRCNLPPSPPRLPVIGHMHLVGSNPHVSLDKLSKEYAADGGLMLLQLGQVRNLVVSSSRAAEAVLRTHDHVFASRPPSAIADILANGSSNIAFAPYSEYWRQARKLVATHLLSAKKVSSLRRAREAEVSVAIAKIQEAVAAGATVDMSELLGSYVNDVLCRAVSGESFREDGRNKLFRELAAGNSAQYAGFHLEDYFPSLAKVNLLRGVVSSKTKKLKERWDKLLDEIIHDHANKSPPLHHHQDADFVDVLLSRQQEYNLTKQNVNAILMDMFAAGSDTSYIVLEFALAELMRKPRLMAKLQAEVRNRNSTDQLVSEEHLMNSMPFLKAVVKETLRLHPPVPLLLPRVSMARCDDVNGYTIPADTRVIVNAWALGRDARYWEDPEEFMPERWFVDSTNDADFIGGLDFRLLPFGAGRRVCPGTNFGMASVEIMLASLVSCFDWELPAGMEEDDVDLTGVFGLTMFRKEKLYLVPRQHNTAS